MQEQMTAESKQEKKLWLLKATDSIFDKDHGDMDYNTKQRSRRIALYEGDAAHGVPIRRRRQVQPVKFVGNLHRLLVHNTNKQPMPRPLCTATCDEEWPQVLSQDLK